MRCTIPEIAMQAPEPLRSFRAFRTLKLAIAFVGRHAEANCRLSKRCYGADVRDVRYVVNFTGSVRKERIALEKARLVMWHGMTVNRRLPVVAS